MSFLFKPGYGSNLSNQSQSSNDTRNLVLRGFAQKIIDIYPAYQSDDGAGYIDFGNRYCVQLIWARDYLTEQIIFWMAKASGVELSSSEIATIQMDNYALFHGTPFEGDTFWWLDEDEA